MATVQLHQDDGSFLQSGPMSQEEAEALASAYFAAINTPMGMPRPTRVVSTSNTHGLPAAWLDGKITYASVVP